MQETAIVMLNLHTRNQVVDLELPLDITAADLLQALNQAYKLGLTTAQLQSGAVKAENPIALLRGNRTLQEYGLHNGSTLHITEEGAASEKI